MIDTINNINREIARILNIDENTVKIVNSFYWKEGIKGAVSSGEHTSIHIKGIGTFVISRHKLHIRINRLIKRVRFLKNNPTRVYKTKDTIQRIKEAIDELTILLARRNELAIIYKANTNKFNEKYKRFLETGLGEQAFDTAGVSEQDSISQGD